MGFFTLELARRVGPAGRVVAPDIEPRMLERLKRRADKVGLGKRIDARLVQSDSLAVEDLTGQVDLTLACAVVHEIQQSARFFMEISGALKPGGRLLVVEPKRHVGAAEWQAELDAAAMAGLSLVERPVFRRSYAALLVKPL